MQFSKITIETIHQLKTIVKPQNVFTDEETLKRYSHDETEDLSFLPEVVVKPETTEEVSALLKFCYDNTIAVTPRGAGTGLSGGALPVFGGISLSMEKMNKIIEIDARNLQAHVEAGVITEVLIDEVAKRNLLYPVDPSSKGSCFIGGNIAHGSGGPRVVKYGTLRDYILNLEVVLPNGEVIWTGANTLKYASGYNLTQLMIGSEGTLGVITKAVLKLVPKPSHNLVMLASFPSADSACEAVSAVFRAGMTPSALEFMERTGMEWVLKYEEIKFELKDNVEAYLLVEVDGNNLETLRADCEKIGEVLYKHGCSDILLGESASEKEELWKIRRKMPLSVKANSVYKEEDTVVPRAELPKLLKGIKEIGNKYGFKSVCYGHAGDGNLHVNIIKESMTEEAWENQLPLGIKEIMQLTVKLGGTLSGEHGIGLIQKPYMSIKFSEVHLQLMRSIKQVFDPKGILNPGKIFN
ncbi:FAD-binding oxidoreductase [Solitalea longa]|uniref:FAD-binding oxidoreductase n=1 Tax=Solitalea longa TaxID=2079460 RepID=A0A2S5A4L6_9SPHI|nr:FAD-linked oxidase C-terminal domain-containing protein [Solitalea longa]POY37474.1 FAD-binding oxidoreductase [Solitalea longa]